VVSSTDSAAGNIYVNLASPSVNSVLDAAGVAAHESKHIVQRLTGPATQLQEVDAFGWQMSVNPAFFHERDIFNRVDLTRSVMRWPSYSHLEFGELPPRHPPGFRW
jgi:hypothetical protein